MRKSRIFLEENMKFGNVISNIFCIIILIIFVALLSRCTSSMEDFGEDTIACVKAQGAGMFTFFTGYAETRIVHIPKALQSAMGIEAIERFTERCWLEESALSNIEALRALGTQ